MQKDYERKAIYKSRNLLGVINLEKVMKRIDHLQK